MSAGVVTLKLQLSVITLSAISGCCFDAELRCGTFWLRNEGLRSSGSAVAK